MREPASEQVGVAIVGMACRFPGATSPTVFWDNLCRGVESVRELSDAELRAAGVDPALLHDPSYVKAAAPLDGADLFDAAFFGYSPKEAATMDPQQRLFLEVAWEAFEDAGYVPDGAPGIVGVFAGGGGVVTSYFAAHPGHPAFAGQTASMPHLGNDKDFLSTRVSYKLDLRGPSVTVQTACSTSLVAVHLACQSLTTGECDMALAGASTVRIPQITGYVAEKGNVHSLDGHCRAFDASGQGTIFGSGVAAVLLKPVARALAEGDPIYAVIKGSAINNDGGRKISYTAPSVSGQARAMVEALTLADVSADTLGYVECHATGTAVGDPLEIEALTRAFRTSTARRQYCAVGSVKTNIGHPEQTAGLAGLIKTALTLRHRRIPPSLHFATPNPKIDFADSPFYVNTALADWVPDGHPRRAAVNSLGIGGTNAFVVVEEAPVADAPPSPDVVRDAHVLTLSARTEKALASYVERVQGFLGRADAADLDDVCYTSNVSRGALAHRFAMVAGSVDELRRQLASARAAGAPGTAARGQAPPRIAFLFTGQGSQYPGMAAGLYRAHPVFRDALDRCDALFRPSLGRSLLDLMFEPEGAGAWSLHDTRYTQPALFAAGWALAEMWRSWGVEPSAVIGHSIGELTAACVAGALTLEDAVRLVSERGRLMQALPAGGAMATLFAGEDVVREALGPVSGAVAIAAVNAPDSTVVSGDECLVDQVVACLSARDVRARRLTVSHAFHSPLMEPMLDAFEDVARGITARPPDMALVSNLTGCVLERAPDAAYWRRHVREPVRFAEGVRTLATLGCNAFIELGPGNALLTLARRTLGATDGRWLASLVAQRDDWRTVMESAAKLYTAGVAIGWEAVHRGVPRRRVSLPTYPFERKRYWVDAAASATPIAAREHPLLGRRAPSSNGGMEFETVYDVDRLAYLRDHRIGDGVVLPTAAAVEAAQAAGREFFGAARVVLEDLVYHEALLLPGGPGPRVRVAMAAQGAGAATFRLMSADGGEAWRTHLSGRVSPQASAEPPVIPPRWDACDEPVDAATFYAAIRRLGLDYGPAFQALRGLRQGDGEAVGEVRLPAVVAPDRYSLHPVLLDACFHIYPALLARNGGLTTLPESDTAFLPVGIERFSVYRDGMSRISTHAVLREGTRDRDTLVLDIRIYDDDANVVAVVDGLSLRRLRPRALGASVDRPPLEWLHRVRWDERPPAPRASESSPGTWLVFADGGGFADTLIESLRRRGHRCHRVARGRRFASRAGDRWTLDSRREGEMERLLGKLAGAPLHGVLYGWALDAPALDDTTPEGATDAEAITVGGALDLARALASTRSAASSAGRLWLLTSHAQAVDPQQDGVEPFQALLWGFGRTLAVEMASVWGGLVDVSSAGRRDADAEALVDGLLAPDGEDQVALRDGRRFVPRLVRIAPGDGVAGALTVRVDATYLLTGGLGMLGLKTARWLVEERGARSLVLTGRSAPGPQATETILELEARGARVHVVRADVGVEADVARLFETLRDLPPLAGVVHGAGVLDDGIVAQMDGEKLARVLAPKARGAWWLHRHVGDRPLGFFVLQSSLLSVTGSSGQSNYTAANAFLDGLAAHRRARGLSGVALNWGPWDEAGMARTSGSRGEAMWKARGVRYLPPAHASRLFPRLFGAAEDHLVIADVDWSAFVRQFPSPPPVYGNLLAEAAPPRPAAAVAAPDSRDIKARLREAPDEARRGVLVEFVRAQVMRELGFEEPIDVRQPLDELGLDSLMSVDVANLLENALSVAVPVVKLIQGPSVEQLVDDLFVDTMKAAGIAVGAQTQGASAPAAAVVVASEEVAGDGWLLFPRRRPAARARLFCFPFAGSGGATFRSWIERLDHGIELVAIDPPGRGSRIGERPLTRLDELVDTLVPRMTPLLDLPAMFFGHCLGALLAYEVASRLRSDGLLDLRHLFVSGSRPPDRVGRYGAFEERLISNVLKLPGFDPALEAHDQPDDVFAAMIRHFNIGATDDFLARPELRRLLFPAVRADFALVAGYRATPPTPWDVPLTCIVGTNDAYVPHEDAAAWSRYTRAGFHLYQRDGTHFLVVDDREFIVEAINAQRI